MDQQISAIIHYVADSHRELARILDSKRHIVVHATQLIHVLPEMDPHDGGIEPIVERSLKLTKGVISYLLGLAELEDALADNLETVMKELKDENGGE
ncbi:nucleoside-diphosphate sugar epimerase [Paenibacillus cymbidii]|uniref:nucleoside-diphosphate sugar epimerase n=1 Tax=Paenibacillus cymbidii TaxID=1639034 RepID=UPI0010818983|nr:nucleoside-diphosphate sugar epimerase [Paenibacillus cymbidii]